MKTLKITSITMALLMLILSITTSVTVFADEYTATNDTAVINDTNTETDDDDICIPVYSYNSLDGLKWKNEQKTEPSKIEDNEYLLHGSIGVRLFREYNLANAYYGTLWSVEDFDPTGEFGITWVFISTSQEIIRDKINSLAKKLAEVSETDYDTIVSAIINNGLEDLHDNDIINFLYSGGEGERYRDLLDDIYGYTPAYGIHFDTKSTDEIEYMINKLCKNEKIFTAGASYAYPVYTDDPEATDPEATEPEATEPEATKPDTPATVDTPTGNNSNGNNTSGANGAIATGADSPMFVLLITITLICLFTLVFFRKKNKIS